ncbi:MAG: tetratricopeptide repeat protein, partial [Cyanobacteria bacterium J06638_20]
QSALQVYTREAFPQQWAMTQNNLGTAYKNRIRGERADNLERAIDAFQAALQVYTREAFPQQWAMTQNNLGIAYSDRIRGERADNLERAIDAYQSALQVRTREVFPQDWAMTQNNLGIAYKNRIRGERGENLEQAIDAYQSALQVRTREALPEKWAMTQGSLVSAFLERFKLTGEASDLDEAIASLQDAGEVAIPGTDSYIFIHYTLGIALDYRYSLHHKSADLEQAIAAYRVAADTTPWEDDKADYLEKVGDSQYQLGVAFVQEGRWYDGLAYLEASLQTYRQGQNRLARADALQQMARTHYLMGNFEKALLYFRDALRIYQAEANEPGEANCRAGLGRLMLRLNFIDEAMAELNTACTLYHKLGDDTRLQELQKVYALAEKVRQKQPLESKL